MSEPQTRPSPDSADAAAERQVEALVEHFLEQLRAGQSVDRAAFVAARPDLAPLLDRRLALVEMMHRVAQGGSPVGGSGDQQPVGPAERALHLKCPHCGNRIQLVQPEAQEVTCRNCGSSFHVEPGATAPYRPEDLPKTIGRFQVLELLGRGAFGAVYKARDPELDRIVAVKVPRAGYFANPQEEERFVREARSAAHVSHPNVVAVHEIGHDRGVPYIVSDFIDGLTLADLLSGNRPSFRQSAELVAQVADALDCAHRQKVIHRDIKPGNILLDRSGRPHLTDFGLARKDEGEITVTLDGQILGTPAYMAPEQAAGDQSKVAGQSDVYSLGVVLYELLTGELPFRGTRRMLLHQVLQDEPRPPRHLNDLIPRDLETICLKAMAKEPGRRYATACGLAEDLGRFLNGEPILARPVGRTERLWRWCRRNPVVTGLAAAVGFLLVAGTVIASYFAIRAEEKATEAGVNYKRILEEKAETDAARSRADQQLLRAEWLVYAGQIGLAQRDWEAGNLAHARDLLDACRPDFRGWEHAYLRRLFDGNQRTFRGHSTRVDCVAFSPDGQRIVSGSADGTVKVWDCRTGNAIFTVNGHNEPVRGVALSPRPGQPSEAKRSVEGRIQQIASVALSPDGKRIVSGSRAWEIRDPGELKLWDAHTGQEILTFKGHTNWVNSVAFSPDGKRIVSGGEGWETHSKPLPGELKVWDTQTGKEALPLKGHADRITSVAFSPDGKRIASGSYDNSIKLWDAQTGQEVRTLKGHSSWVTSVSFCPDARRIVSASYDGTLKVWDSQTGREIRAFQGSARSVAYSPDGKWIAGGCLDNTVKVWNAQTGQETHAFKGHSSWPMCVAYSPDGRRIASAGGDSTIKLWDALASQEAPTIKGMPVTSVAYSRDGKHIAGGGGGYDWQGKLVPGQIKVWDAQTGQETVTIKGHDQMVWSVAFSPDGKRIVSGCFMENAPKVWDAQTGQETLTLKGHTTGIFCVAYSPDGKHIASASDDRTLKVWDSQSGQETHTLKGHTGQVGHVAYSPDGNWIISGSNDNSLKVWNTASGQQALSKQFNGGVGSLAYSLDGKRIVIGSLDNTVKILNAETCEEILILKGHANGVGVTSVAYSPDGQRIFSGGGVSDNTLRIWDAVTGQEILTLKRRSSLPNSLALSPDGRRLVSPGDGNTIKVWDARPLSQDVMEEREAVALVEFLLAQPLARADARVSLQEDQTVSDAVRQQALAFLERYREEKDPRRFHDAARSVAELPYSTPQLYRPALIQAETACRLSPQNGPFLTTLGMAQYRVGKYQEAADTLTRAGQLNAGAQKGSVAADLAFLALSQHRLGHKEKARSTLERLRETMKKPEWARNEEAHGFRREAEAVLGNKP